MEDNKAIVFLVIGVLMGVVLATISSNPILLLVGWVLIGYCGSGIYFWYKNRQEY